MKIRTVKILKGLGIAAIAWAVVYAVLLGLSNRALRNAYAALEKGGRPLLADEIIPAELPNAENAALIYEAVVLQLKAEAAGEEDVYTALHESAVRFLSDPSAEKAKEQFQRLTERSEVQRALELLARGAQKSGCRYDLDYTQGAGLTLPHLTGLRHLTRILCAQAAVNMEGGDVEQAWEDILTALRIANALQDEPLLISQLVRMSQFSDVADRIDAMVQLGAPNPTQRDQFIDLLKRFEQNTSFVTALDGERLLLGEWVFGLPKDELGRSMMLGQSGPGMYKMVSGFRPFLQYDHAVYLRTLHALTQMAAAPYDADSDAAEERMLTKVPGICVFSGMLIPAVFSAKREVVEMRAKARVIRAGLMLRSFADSESGFPDTLEALNGEDLTDPFTGNPLVYRKTDKGFRVYSVGKDQKGNGDDIVWAYSREP